MIETDEEKTEKENNFRFLSEKTKTNPLEEHSKTLQLVILIILTLYIHTVYFKFFRFF